MSIKKILVVVLAAALLITQISALSLVSAAGAGDINRDGEVNNKDLTRLFQYLSGWDVEVDGNALDVNGDEKVNNKDLTRLFQYLSGWDVKIFYSGGTIYLPEVP